MRSAGFWSSAIALAASLLLPWYLLQDGIGSLSYAGGAWLTDPDGAPALGMILAEGRWWLWPAVVAPLAGLAGAVLPMSRPARSWLFLLAGGLGLMLLAAQGWSIGPRGWMAPWLQAAWGDTEARQYGIGWGGTVVSGALIVLLAAGLAGRGAFRGDAFTATVAAVLTVAIVVFTILPIGQMMAGAFRDAAGGFAPASAVTRLADDRLWGLGCLAGAPRCGVVWNTLLLALLTAAGTTALGLAFALLVTRGRLRFPGPLRWLTVLPIVTPPFILGLGLILIFGRSGLLSQAASSWFGWELGRWIYGLPGLLLAQLFAFTPIAFLVLIGVVEGLSPTLEEASSTLRADERVTFRTVTLPLLLPGLANAFLLGFVESIADFGNAVVLGGSFNVLATEIFFAVVGAQADAGRAASLSLILLVLTLVVFFLQQRLTGRKSYVSISGKGDSGLPPPLPRGVRRLCVAVAGTWGALTVGLYVLAFMGGFVEVWGRDYTPTLRHFAKAFSIEGGQFTGLAWNSVLTTLELAAISAPITAALGILAAWLFSRTRFAGKGALEFATLLSFAVPGTVIGVAYLAAFNLPPLELAGTGAIIVACFVFRNLPVGLRSGMAAMAQIDRSLDEASHTLGGGGLDAFRRVVLPLLRPAIVAGLTYSFVRAMTTVSAVIFLVTAETELATVFIVNRIINGDYGLAISTSLVLIVLMLAVLGLMNLAVGRRRIGRRAAATPAAAAPVPGAIA
ncbi:ABC transporter permease [Roseomonas haemaphysalidis]|uniref:Iron ABC transporter permease n=1 Tax=Roseomonas haemaphysalidis TaxID=2768162 RepID=A0ABS3KX19_9PROT|nr:iron ABC transporter permease [Roseomonas haemaphysalidis]MBO1081198.1 iron ABC transporter permease [Roseomonas haemaphysalidis]